MHPPRFLAACMISASMILAPAPGMAHDACANSAIDLVVTSASPLEQELVCVGVERALHLLARCEITPRGPIDIRLQREIRHPLAGPIFGAYDLTQRFISLTSFASLPTLMEHTPYEGLPRDDFYESLVVHEVVHSIMHQNLGQRAQSEAAYEYPAYALQIASLPAPARAQFMEHFDKERIARAGPFSDTVLAFAPYFFAARAYSHFATSPDGCAKIRALMSGEDRIESAQRLGAGSD